MIPLGQHLPPCWKQPQPFEQGGTLLVGPLGSNPGRSAGAQMVGRAASSPEQLGHVQVISFAREAEPQEVTASVAAALAERKFDRVIAFGNTASKGIFGAGHNAARVRRGYGKLPDDTVVWLMPDPAHVSRNRIRKNWMQDDLKWCLGQHPVTTRGEMIYVHELSALQIALLEDQAVEVAWDVETFGHFTEEFFRIVTCALSVVGDDRVYVWRDEDLLPGNPLRNLLVRLLKRARKAGHNIKMEHLCAEHYLGVRTNAQDPDDDTYVMARLLKADGAAGLEELATHVGLVGHKSLAEELTHKVELTIEALRRARTKEVVVEWGQELRVNEKTGKTQKRKVALTKRPPTAKEADQQALDELAKRRLKVEGLCGTDEEWLIAARHDDDPAAYSLGLIDPRVREVYCALDVLATNQLLLRYRQEMAENPELDFIYREVVQLAPRAFAHVERAGLNVDLVALSELEEFLDQRTAGLLSQIREIAGPEFEPNSNPQLADLLFKQLGMPVQAVTKTGPSVAKSVLMDLRADHPVVQMILDWKESEKLQSNYARGLRPFIRSNGRVHCVFNIAGAETGRMSCKNPNMTTLPSRGQFAKKVKKIYRARPGYTWIVLDFKTLEPRVAAILSGDPDMIQTFRDGVDFHDRTAEIICPIVWGNDYETCGIDPSIENYAEVLAAERKRRRGIAKTVGLAILYGQGAETMAENAHCTVKEAEAAQQAILAKYRGLKRWIEKCIADGHRTGCTWTYWMGRKARCRPIPDIGDQDNQTKSHGERTTYNTPCQGTGHEFLLASMCEAVRWLEDDQYDATANLAVHDAAYLEVAIEERDEVAKRMKKTMEQWWFGEGDTAVPLLVDIETGDTLGTLGPWQEGVWADAA